MISKCPPYSASACYQSAAADTEEAPASHRAGVRLYSGCQLKTVPATKKKKEKAHMTYLKVIN